MNRGSVCAYSSGIGHGGLAGRVALLILGVAGINHLHRLL
jgi:hypothetical protein